LTEEDEEKCGEHKFSGNLVSLFEKPWFDVCRNNVKKGGIPREKSMGIAGKSKGLCTFCLNRRKLQRKEKNKNVKREDKGV